MKRHHTGVISYYGRDDVKGTGRQALVLEFFQGVELAKVIKEKKLEDEQKLEVVSQPAKTYAHLHSVELVHRDIKPANIMINVNTLETKVIDYGLAYISKGNEQRTRMCGTPQYMAPSVWAERPYSMN